jgi:prefoldin alpha subunit
MKSGQDVEEGLQSAVAELKVLEDYYAELGAREAILVQAVSEARAAQEVLSALPRDGMVEILSPIGGGVVLPVTYDSKKKLRLNIGANTTIEATPERSYKYLEEKIAELDRAVSKIRGQREELAARINRLRSQISRILQQGSRAATG